MSRARETAKVLSAQSATGNINLSGLVTATSYTGSGVGLTGLPAGQLTGALPAIDGSALTGISAGSTVADDTSTDETFFPVFTQTTSGTISASKVSTTNLTFNPATPTLQIGTGSTINGSGTVSFAGTVYAEDLVLPLKIDGFSPIDGATNVQSDTTIEVIFNNPIGLGTTGFIRIQDNGGEVETFSIGSSLVSITNANRSLTINPSQSLPKGLPPSSNVITTVVESDYISTPGFTGINTTGGMATYTFTMADTAIGEAYGGGYLVCASGGTQWIVAPIETESGQSWGNRCQSTTDAEAQAACGDWFHPSLSQLQNPGRTCRTHWDAYSTDYYWSDTQNSNRFAWKYQINNGTTAPYNTPFQNLGNGACVRAFRTISY
tara:strand:- start:3429 stop:4562 length:1134 start_codon:yes stop_codon:yes gene_type:complete